MSDTPRTNAVDAKCNELELKDAVFYTILHFAKLERELNASNERIKRLEAGDAALNYSIGLDLQKENDVLKDRIHRAASAFFRDGSDGQVASGMLTILEEERGKK